MAVVDASRLVTNPRTAGPLVGDGADTGSERSLPRYGFSHSVQIDIGSECHSRPYFGRYAWCASICRKGGLSCYAVGRAG